MRSKTLSTAAAVAALALTATACNSAGSGSGSDVKVGLSLSTLNNPFFVQFKEGAEAEAKASGADLSIVDAQNDAARQADQMQNFTGQNMKSVIINPVDSDAAAASVEAAGQADIPVVAADRGVNKAEVATTVASDNVGGGELAAKTLAERLGGKGRIVVLEGTAGTSASRERGQGFAEGLKAYPGIEVASEQPAEFDRAKALDVMTNVLQSNSGIDGVFAENDEMALGAIKALGKKAGTSVDVVGFDGTPEALEAVEAGTLTATVAQQPKELGKLAVRNAVALARGEKVKTSVQVPVKVVAGKDSGAAS